MPEKYNPGQRKFGANRRVADTRIAWIQTHPVRMHLLKGEDNGSGSDIVLVTPRPGPGPNPAINLSNMTVLELDAYEQLITTAIAMARPVAMQRDKEAQDAWDSGDDSYERSYRQPPVVVYRSGSFAEHREGVRERLEGSADGGGAGDDGGVRGAGDELAEPQQVHSEPQDDGPSTDDVP